MDSNAHCLLCAPGIDPFGSSSCTLLNVHLSLQVGNNDVDDINIIVFRQINQFDLSGNVITSSEYLSTLWVSPEKDPESKGERFIPAGSGFSLLQAGLARQLPAAG